MLTEACEGLLRYTLLKNFQRQGYTWQMSGSDADSFGGVDWTRMGKTLESAGQLYVRHVYIGDAGILAHIEYPAKRYDDGAVGYSPQFGKDVK